MVAQSEYIKTTLKVKHQSNKFEACKTDTLPKEHHELLYLHCSADDKHVEGKVC